MRNRGQFYDDTYGYYPRKSWDRLRAPGVRRYDPFWGWCGQDTTHLPYSGGLTTVVWIPAWPLHHGGGGGYVTRGNTHEQAILRFDVRRAVCVKGCGIVHSLRLTLGILRIGRVNVSSDGPYEHRRTRELRCRNGHGMDAAVRSAVPQRVPPRAGKWHRSGRREGDNPPSPAGVEFLLFNPAAVAAVHRPCSILHRHPRPAGGAHRRPRAIAVAGAARHINEDETSSDEHTTTVDSSDAAGGATNVTQAPFPGAARIVRHRRGRACAAMGGAYTGVANDYSAMCWNPAGLAQMQYSIHCRTFLSEHEEQ
jgi:hypothetical protein